jgi:hypothetical protein
MTMMITQVVFKALIVLHTMIRNGSTDNVLSYLSTSSEVLHLRNVAGANWEGAMLDSPRLVPILTLFHRVFCTPESSTLRHLP